jgi:hypothetical protein
MPIFVLYARKERHIKGILPDAQRVPSEDTASGRCAPLSASSRGRTRQGLPQSRIQQTRFVHRERVRQDIARLVRLAHDVSIETHAHEIENVPELFHQRQCFDSRVISADQHHICRLLAHHLAEITARVPQALRPPVDKVFHQPRHPVPVDRCRQNQGVVDQYTLDDEIVIVIHPGKAARGVAPIIDGTNGLLYEEDLFHRKVFHDSIGEQFRVAVTARASVYR